MSELNINNLELDDNSFYVAEEGDYHFRVVSHELDYYSGSSTKIPANTQQLICHLEIPVTTEDGQMAVVNVKHTMNVYKKALFAIRQFTDCIGITPEHGKAKLDLEELDGAEGIARFTVQVSNNGNEYNRLDTAYAPSKAPMICENDSVWDEYKQKYDGFISVSGSDEPWI